MTKPKRRRAKPAPFDEREKFLRLQGEALNETKNEIGTLEQFVATLREEVEFYRSGALKAVDAVALAERAAEQTERAMELARSAVERAQGTEEHRALTEKAIALAEEGRERELELRRDVEAWQARTEAVIAVAATLKESLDLSSEEVRALRDFVRGHLTVAPSCESAPATAAAR